MDTRVKPAYDAVCVGALAHFTSLPAPPKRHRCPQIALREWWVQRTSLEEKRGRWNAERRVLGSWCRSMFSVLEKQRPRKRLSDVPPRRSFSLGPLFEGTEGSVSSPITTDFPPSPAPRPAISWQAPIVGPGGIPRPPECKELRLLLARGRRSHPAPQSVLKKRPSVRWDT